MAAPSAAALVARSLKPRASAVSMLEVFANAYLRKTTLQSFRYDTFRFLN